MTLVYLVVTVNQITIDECFFFFFVVILGIRRLQLAVVSK